VYLWLSLGEGEEKIITTKEKAFKKLASLQNHIKTKQEIRERARFNSI